VRLLIALVQAALIVAIGATVFGVAWGQTAGVCALVLVYACVATGAALTVGAVARNAEQATAIGIPVGIALGMLGGCMWPLDIVPPGLRAIGHLTPQAWAMDGFTSLIFNGKGLLDITVDLAVLTGFAIALLTLGVVLLRRTLTHAA
jgi:ABC-2 type transport system permease protein